MRGLSNKSLHSRLKTNSRIKIYCTDVTKRLLCTMKPYEHLEDYLVCLNVDEPTSVTIPGDDDNTSDVDVVFTAMAAGHCPGSAMLLVEGSEATVLYTGDFRLEKGTAGMIGALHDAQGNKKRIDAIYCDCTFLTPKLPHIPTREECEEEMIQQIQEHIAKGSNYHILIRAKAKIGYESVFRIIYDRLGVKTHIQSRDGYLYSRLPNILETITPQAKDTQIHVCCRFIQTQEDCKEGVKLSAPATEVCDVLSSPDTVTKIIHLSTMYFITRDQKQLQVQTGPSTDVVTVRCCYSFHSSYSEIEDLIRYYQPLRVIPNVSPIGYSREETKQMLEKFISDTAVCDSPEPEDTWKSINKIDFWWKSPKKSGSAHLNQSRGSLSPPYKRPKHSDEVNNDSSSTRSRQSTPEMDLFSSSDSDGDTTPAPSHQINGNTHLPNCLKEGPATDCKVSLGVSELEVYDSDDDDLERQLNKDYHSQLTNLL